MYPLRILVLWAAAFLVVVPSMVNGSHLSVNTSASIFRVDPEYVSVTMDFQMVALPPDSSIPRWFAFGFNNTRIRTLLRGLSPCYLRFGGTGADMTVFSDRGDSILYNQPTEVKMYNVFAEDIDNLIALTRASGARLLYDLNLSLRYLSSWDPNNALRLIRYITSKGYGDNVDFELGNEPNQYRPHSIPPWPWPPVSSKDGYRQSKDGDLKQVLLSGKQIGLDFVSLVHLVRNFPTLSKSKVVGPDLAGGYSNVMPDYLNVSGGMINATTFHHYYFEGRSAKPSEYIKPSHFDTLRGTIQSIKDLIKEHSPNKQLPIWNGETSDAYNSGTPNVSNRFISGFLWLDKLGLSAQMGVGVVMRQTFYGGFYGLVDGHFNPNSDYWVSYIHNLLVGRRVFNTTVRDMEQLKFTNKLNGLQGSEKVGPLLVRLYAQCTKPSKRYMAGSLAVFGINLKNESELVTFDPDLAHGPIDEYILTPYGKDGLLSRNVALNGKLLNMLDDSTFPDLVPVSHPSGTKGVNFPPLSFGFWIFPKQNLKRCADE